MAIITTRDLKRIKRSRTELPKLTSAQIKNRGKQRLHTIIKNGAWKGRPCFLVGGGPSLVGFDWSRLSGELSIGINRTFEKFDPTILFSMDNRFWKWVEQGDFGMAARDKFRNYQYGIKLWVNVVGAPYSDDIFTVTCCGDAKWSHSLSDGVGAGGNSGYAALNLAYLLGANPIYLLGYDMHGDLNGKQKWFHNGYPINQGSGVYIQFLNKFNQIAVPALKNTGVRVINLNSDSALRCFEFGSLNNVEPVSMPTVVAYYTSKYSKEAEKLKNSLRFWGLRREIHLIGDQGSWQRNTQYKPVFLLKMLDACKPHPIVYVDADATIESYPDWFENLDGCTDFSAHLRKKKLGNVELLSGTIYLANNQKTRNFLKHWMKVNEQHPDLWDQKNLHTALLEHPKEEKLKFTEMPSEYCTIFDAMPEAGDSPVITHWQASRRLKHETRHNSDTD